MLDPNKTKWLKARIEERVLAQVDEPMNDLQIIQW